MTVNPVDDPAVISGDFNANINEDGVATGDLNASDIEGLTDGTYFTVLTPPTHGLQPSIPLLALDLYAKRELLRTGRIPGKGNRRPAGNTRRSST